MKLSLISILIFCTTFTKNFRQILIAPFYTTPDIVSVTQKIKQIFFTHLSDAGLQAFGLRMKEEEKGYNLLDGFLYWARLVDSLDHVG